MAGRFLLVALLGLSSSASTLFAQTPVTARSAYDAKDWKTCAVLYAQMADLRPVPRTGATLRVADCLSLAGDKDAAFERLHHIPVSDAVEVSDIEQDDDLKPLHDDPRWPQLLNALKIEEATRKSHYDQALYHELVIRVHKDQEARDRLWKDKKNKTLATELDKVDKDNLIWLKSVVDRQGWPTISQVGPQGAGSFWLLAQHADSDPAFQERVYKLMAELVPKGEAIGYQLAYLQDRVLRAQNKPQIYGTQLKIVNNKLVPEELEAPEQVDARRASVGMGPMHEYILVSEKGLLSKSS